MKIITIINEDASQSNGGITDRVKTFEDACDVLGIKGEIFTASLHEDLANDCAAIKAFTKLLIITRALNEGWTPDWNNNSEYKYYPWFKMGRGFVLNDVLCLCTGAAVGSRLCFKNEQLAEYAAKQFNSIYKDFFTL